MKKREKYCLVLIKYYLELDIVLSQSKLIVKTVLKR